MGLHINKLYSRLKTEKDHILTEEAEKKYAELSGQWKKLTKDLTDEENIDYIYLRVLFTDFLNICCKDHFSKGLTTGVDITYKLIDKLLPPSEEEYDDEDDCDNK